MVVWGCFIMDRIMNDVVVISGDVKNSWLVVTAVMSAAAADCRPLNVEKLHRSGANWTHFPLTRKDGGDLQLLPNPGVRHDTHLIVLRGRDEEEDGGDRVEAVEPAAPLRPLTANVHHLEGNFLDLKVVLVDPLGGLPGQQDVLLAGKVVLQEDRVVLVRCPEKHQ